MKPANFVATGQSGCLLPTLIIFNLFFGKFIFGSTRLWLGIEVILVLLLAIKIHVFVRKISAGLRSGINDLGGCNQDSPLAKNRGQVIDVTGEEVQEKKKLQ